MLLPEDPAPSSDTSEQAAVVHKTEGNERAGLTSPGSETEEQAERQEPAGENAAAEQVFMYLQVSFDECSVETFQCYLAHWCMLAYLSCASAVLRLCGACYIAVALDR